MGITTDPYCAWGTVETTDQFLLECNAFNEIRQEIFNEICSFCTATFDILLYGSDAFSDQHN